jgi:hypothetical protein
MGKLLLYLVVGFSMLYMIMGNNSNKMATKTIENMADYNAKSTAHNIAISGINMACNEIFINNNWTTGYNNVDFNNGEFDVSVQVIDPFRNRRRVTSVGNFGGISDTVEVIFQPSSFSKFAYYSVSESGIHWHDGDTVWGPWHSQDYITVSQSPVFFGKVTTKKGIKYNIPPYNPQFLGGFEQGVDVPMPATSISDLEGMALDDGKRFTGKDTLYLTFAGDSVKFRTRYGNKDSTFLLSSLAPNGVLYVKDGVVRLKGTIKGQYTVGSNKRIYIDDDIVYNTDPRINPNSTDLFGIVTDQDVLVADKPSTYDGLNLHASIFCRTQGFGAQNPSTRPNSGQLKLLGGIQQYYRKLVSDPWPQHGFAKAYRYDERLMLASPPGYPGTGKLEIVSWYE